MAFEATTQLYRREAGLQNARAQQEYDRYVSDLARQYGIAEQGLNANLEGRGIFRSGEASTARTRLSAENQAMRSNALQDLEYRKQMNDINLLKQLASLQANSTQQGSTQPAQFAPVAPPAASPKVPYFGFNPTNPYTALPKTPVGKPTSQQTLRPIGTEERRFMYAGR
jgi:hypothetical protein